MNYEQTLQYLYNQLPFYQRIGKAAYKADLYTSLALDKYFDHPHRNFKSIHIAGTNGKGSVAHMIASIIQEEGYTCGLYTSPHLKDFRERIKINGCPISKNEICRFISKNKSLFEKFTSSFFEMSVALAFHYFKNKNVDYAVIETGMGGRLDSTNIITPLVSVITNIGFDHTEFLGNTLEEIAIEKAGIIKPNIPVIIGEANTSLRDVFSKTASGRNAPVYFAEDTCKATKTLSATPRISILTINVPDLPELSCDLPGNYQEKNVATVLQTIKVLKNSGVTLSHNAILQGIGNTVKNTGIYGRWQILQESPLVVCDVAHNEDGLRAITKQIKATPHQKLHFVLGFVKDKNINALLSVLPSDAYYYFCKADIPRGLDVNELSKVAKQSGLKGSSHTSVNKAYEAAMKAASKDDMVCISGSTFIVAEVPALFDE